MKPFLLTLLLVSTTTFETYSMEVNPFLEQCLSTCKDVAINVCYTAAQQCPQPTIGCLVPVDPHTIVSALITTALAYGYYNCARNMEHVNPDYSFAIMLLAPPSLSLYWASIVRNTLRCWFLS